MERFGIEQLASLVTLDDIEREAIPRLTHMAYEYFAGGAGAGLTVEDNRAAFNRIWLRPRVLVDVSRIDTRVELFGRMHPFPILLAPVGYQKLAHPEGEIETVRGADAAEATLVAATFANVTYEAMAEVAQRPLWFQVYIQSDRGFTKELIERALAAGCEAICVTVDSPLIGPRDRELRAGFHLPEGVERANLAKLGGAVAGAAHRPSGRKIYSGTHAADATWSDVEWLRSIVPVKLLLKGILRGEDAARAIAAGCDGVVVSNHGGRSVDTVLATIQVLPEIARVVGGRVPVLMDGGIRRGIDVFKALARGATAVMIGRPYVYGLAVGGAAGVARVVEILRSELEMTMGLVGCTTLEDLAQDFLWQASNQRD